MKKLFKKLFKGNCGCTPFGLKTSFQKCCVAHDIDYSVYSRVPRKEADKRFLKCMLEIAEIDSATPKWIKKAKAYVYFGAVRAFGGFFFKGGGK